MLHKEKNPLYGRQNNSVLLAERELNCTFFGEHRGVILRPVMTKDSPGPAWVSAICSVVFDIDEGQKLEQCFPENALTEEEANDVAFHCFPVPAQQAASHCTVVLTLS